MIGRAAGNRYFDSLYNSLLAVSLRLARTVFAYAPQSGEFAVDYYLEICAPASDGMIKAIEGRRTRTAADELARAHTDLFRRIASFATSNKNLAGWASVSARSQNWA